MHLNRQTEFGFDRIHAIRVDDVVIDMDNVRTIKFLRRGTADNSSPQLLMPKYNEDVDPYRLFGKQAVTVWNKIRGWLPSLCDEEYAIPLSLCDEEYAIPLEPKPAAEG